ncbi:MAG: YciK family oxidoreductase [Pseudomonadota bacterium]
MTTIDSDTLTQFAPDANALHDKVILITGASDGIGKALAVQAASFGATVILLGRSEKKLSAVYDTIVESGGPTPVMLPLDFLKADGGVYLSIAEQIKADFGRLDGLVHCAGILGEMTDIEEYDGTIWQQVMHVNTTAPFALTKVCIPLLKTAKGSVVFASSSVGRKGRAFWGAYSVSKFAIEGLAQTLADELSASDVRVNAVNPGGTRTNMRLQAYPAEDRTKLKTPDEVTPAFLYFLCDTVGGVTGQSVNAQ